MGLPGRRLYLTNRGDLTPMQAQIELALPPHNSGTAVFRVNADGLDPGQVILQRRVTGNVFSRGGGGWELVYDGTVPLDYVERIR